MGLPKMRHFGIGNRRLHTMLLRLILFSGFIFLLTLPALATVVPIEDPCVYVSTFSSHQILCVDRGTHVVKVIYTGDANFNPRDLVTGPDGNVYIADSDGDILRFNPTPTPPNTPISLTIVTTLPAVAGSPEGLSFSGSDNLYVNTRGLNSTGIWKIPNAAKPSEPLPIPNGNLTNVISTTGGAGIAFGIPGNLLFVDQPHNKVYSSSPQPGPEPYTAPPEPTPLITSNLTSPVGLAVNTCGNVMVGSGSAIKRYANGQLSNYVSFSNSDVVRYFEFTSGNTAFVVTSNN